MQLINGDAFELIKEIPDGGVDAVIVDPPYNFNYQQQNDMQRQFERVSKSGLIIVFCPPENQWQIFPKSDQYLFWVKPISTKNTSKNYARFVEMIQVFGRNEWDASRHWSQYTNVFTDLVESKLHPYQKPLSLMTRLVLNHTKEGDVVLDAFMGSASTGVACLQNGRDFIGIEQDYKIFELAKERLNKVYEKQEKFG